MKIDWTRTTDTPLRRMFRVGRSLTVTPERKESYLPLYLFLVAAIVSFFLTMPGCGADEAWGAVDTTRAVIHHTESGCWTTVEDVRRWHVEERKWDDIGYHFLITCDGVIHEGRPITKHGAHARTGKPYSRNGWVGIALVGKNSFSDSQLKSLTKLIKRTGITYTENHHKDCPGEGLDYE